MLVFFLKRRFLALHANPGRLLRSHAGKPLGGVAYEVEIQQDENILDAGQPASGKYTRPLIEALVDSAPCKNLMGHTAWRSLSKKSLGSQVRTSVVCQRCMVDIMGKIMF